jgi:hypothetical protein
MPSELPSIEIEVSSDFKRNLRALAKRYRHIRSDLEPLLAQLQAGDCPGDQISGIAYAALRYGSEMPMPSEVKATATELSIT